MKKNILSAISLTTLCVSAFLFSCNPSAEKNATTEVKTDSSSYTATIDGKSVLLYTLKNKQGASVSITNYGGRVV